jgi:hypothetical protein
LGFAVCASIAFLSLAQTAPPPPPRLALDTYPAAAREAISRAHQEATLRSTSADTVGALGRILHAWEQWDGAHQAYARAQALAPGAFDWPYLDAVVLQRSRVMPSPPCASARRWSRRRTICRRE